MDLTLSQRGDSRRGRSYLGGSDGRGVDARGAGPLTAGGFIYLATAGLMPVLQHVIPTGGLSKSGAPQAKRVGDD